MVDHPQPAYALRLTDGRRTLVYSGDTGPCTALDALAAGCDLLLAEAAFLEGKRNTAHLHMTGRQAAEAASRAGVGRLVLTHVPPWHSPDDVLKDARPHFAGDIIMAATGDRYDV